MNLSDHLQLAWDEMKAHRFRAFLTSLGVIMGVGSVLAMIAIGDGAKAEADKQIQAMGANQVFVRQKDPDLEEANKNKALSKGLRVDDALAIAKIPGVVAISPEGRGFDQMRYEDYAFDGNVMLVLPGYAEVHNRNPQRGRFLTEEDVLRGSKVCVLRKQASPGKRQWWNREDPVAKIFKRGDPLGKTLVIGNVPYEIVGVVEDEQQAQNQLVDIYWGGWREVVFVPNSAYWHRHQRQDNVWQVNVKVASSDVVEPVVDDISQLLLHRHGGIKDFDITTMKENLAQTFQMLGMFNIVFGVLAGVGLFVGGIGIMNIMLASLNERIREVGLRKSIGARNRDILIQFLSESVLLSSLGGSLGIVLGGLMAGAVSLFTHWMTVIRPEAVAISFGFAVGVGVLFGMYPARRASRLNPIEALRSL